MFGAAPTWGGHLAYRGPKRIDGRQRTLAIAAVIALHVALIAGFVIAQLHPPAPPPEKTLSVSFITETAASTAPTPPQPQIPPPPPPKAQMMATSSPTPSPMTAPPMERQPERSTPTQPAPPSPQAPAAAPASNAPVATATTPPNFTAAYLNNPGPAYPVASRRRHEEGVVRLRVQVSPEGAPLQVLLDRSSGSSDLDGAALDVVKKRWKFAPAKQGDRAVSAWVIVPMEFSLKNR